MKAAVLHNYDEALKRPDFVRYEEVPEPKIEKPTDVIVRIGGAGVCRTDLHVIEGLWRSHDSRPTALHHGARERGLDRGGRQRGRDRQAWRPCHLPSACQHGRVAWPHVAATTCTAAAAFPGLDSNGGYAELLKTSDAFADQAAADARAQGRRAPRRCGHHRLPCGEKSLAPSATRRMGGGDRCGRPRPYRHPGAARALARPRSSWSTAPISLSAWPANAVPITR